MIESFAHKGLENFFLTGNTKGIQHKHAKRLRFVLSWLDAASRIEDVNFPGSMLHQLKGDLQGIWSIKVSDNWRITFRFQNGNAQIVNYLDYH